MGLKWDFKIKGTGWSYLILITLHPINFLTLQKSQLKRYIMKLDIPINKLAAASVFLCLSAPVFSQSDSTGLPGDNFSLQGALEMFRKSASPEAFEKAINAKDNNVNNLDLNDDGNTDYIRVIDRAEGNVHTFILQAVVSDKESQDIAVIELEKTGNENAVLQIVGDEDIYGEETIVEPTDAGDNAYLGKSFGPAPDINGGAVIINVWAWPAVRFVYAPAYVLWVSPWRWHHYPGWWRPWRPVSWHVFHPHRFHYHNRYTVVHTHRVVTARRMYTPVRVTSVTVKKRNQVAVTHYRSNRPTSVSRSRTVTTTTPQGRVSASRTKTTTIERGRGNRKVATTRSKTVKRSKKH